MTGGEKTLIAVVTLLVLVFLVLLLDRVGGGSGATPEGQGSAGAGATPTADETGSPIAVVDLAAQEYSFQMPSGNIGCALSAEGVLCAILAFDYEPPAVPGCEADTGIAFALDPEGTSAVCSTGAPDFGGAAELPYGESLTVGEFTCDSTEQGVSCSNGSGQEFSLRRGDYNL